MSRTAKVILELMVDKYISNAKRSADAMKQVGEEAEKAGKKSDKASEQASAELAKLAKAHQDAAKAAGLQYNSAGQLADGNGKVLSSSQAAAHGLDSFSEAVYKSGFALEQAAEKQAAYVARQREAAQTVGTAAIAFGTTTVAALGASAKAAMNWESAWAGVTKTVDGSPDQMRDLESGLRGLAKTLPITHTEIAGVAEAAGQLGVKRQDIIAFTKTMVDLGTTTNLTAEEAATDIAQIANVMGTHGDQIDNFGATLVALGNDGASTEKDILSMAQRISGAGKLVGASEADVLALSNTLSSMGVKAELGGGVTTRVLLKMYNAVQSGGPLLDAFARAAGTSAEQFASAFSTSPVQALDMVTRGLAKTKDAGGNVTEMMTDMGMKGTEEMQVMLSLVGAGDLLTRSLKLGSEAWKENTALLEEAAKRYETTESKAKIAWNNIKDAAIDAGAVMLPVISDVMEHVSNLASGFGDLPPGLQGAVTGLGGVVGAAALAGGGLMLLLPKVKDGISAFTELDTKADGSSRGLGKVGKAAGLAAAGFVGFEIIKSVHNSMQTGAVSTEQMTQNLIALSKQSNSMDKAFADIGAKEFEGEITSAGQALKKAVHQDFNSAVESFGATVLGVDNGMAKINAAFEKADTAIAGAATSGNLELAAKGFKSIADSAKDQGMEVEETAKRFPTYLNALRELASQNKIQIDDAALLKWALGEVPPEMQKIAQGASDAANGLIRVEGAGGTTIPVSQEVADALAEVGVSAGGSVTDLQKFTDALLNTGLITLSARDASRNWSEALLDMGLQADGTGGQIGVLGTAFDNTTAQGIKNQAMFDGVASAGMNNVKAMVANKASNEEVQGALKGTYDGLIAAAGQFGITGGEADALTRKVLGVPDGVSIDSWMDSEAKRMAEETAGAINGIPSRKDIEINIMERTTKLTQYEAIFGESTKSASLFEAQNGGKREGGAIQKRAGGGPINGPGMSTSDEVPILASDGEHMLDRGDVIKMGGHQGVYQFRRDPREWAEQHLAGGGAVGTSVASTSVMSQNIAAQPITLDGLTLVGTMELNATATMATFRGMARQEAAGVLGSADGESRFKRPGRL